MQQREGLIVRNCEWRRSRLVLVLGLSLSWAGALCAQDPTGSAPVNRIDHFFAESGSMEELLSFLAHDLALPEAWPYQDFGSFETGAVSLGNVTFEVVRFDRTDRSGSARFAGIALEPEGDTARLVAWLDRHDVDHGTPRSFPPEGEAFFENTSLPGLIPGGAEVFVCDYKPRQMLLEGQAANRAMLVERDGGALGVLGVGELQVQSTDLARSQAAWSALALQVKAGQSDLVVTFASGPAIRIREGSADRFAGITVSVRSLDDAAAALEAMGSRGVRTEAGLRIAPGDVGGLDILLTEK